MYWLDAIKAVGIVLVVYGHSSIDHRAEDLIYAFHMPLFFFLSGLVFDPTRFRGLPDLVARRGRSYLLPYAVFYILTAAAWWLFEHPELFGPAGTRDFRRLLVGFLFASDDRHLLQHNPPLWFLTCLFSSTVLCWSLKRITRSNRQFAISLAVCSVVGYGLSSLESHRLPWGIDVALTAAVFLGIGSLLRGPSMRLSEWIGDQRSSSRLWFSLPVLVLLGVSGLFANPQLDMSKNLLGSYLPFHLGAWSGIAACVLIGQSLPESRIVAFIGRNTLIVLGFQKIALNTVKCVQTQGLGIPIEQTQGSLLWGGVHTLAAFLLMVPIMLAMDWWRSRRTTAAPIPIAPGTGTTSPAVG